MIKDCCGVGRHGLRRDTQVVAGIFWCSSSVAPAREQQGFKVPFRSNAVTFRALPACNVVASRAVGIAQPHRQTTLNATRDNKTKTISSTISFCNLSFHIQASYTTSPSSSTHNQQNVGTHDSVAANCRPTVSIRNILGLQLRRNDLQTRASYCT